MSESLGTARAEASEYLENYRLIAEARNTREGNRRPGNATDLDDQMARGNIIAGDPARCIEIIEHWRELLGLTTISGTFYFGGMPHELAMENIRLFAEKVAPAFDRHVRQGAAARGPAQLAPASSG